MAEVEAERLSFQKCEGAAAPGAGFVVEGGDQRAVFFRRKLAIDEATHAAIVVQIRFKFHVSRFTLDCHTSITFMAVSSSRSRARARCSRASIAAWLAPRWAAIWW